MKLDLQLLRRVSPPEARPSRLDAGIERMSDGVGKIAERILREERRTLLRAGLADLRLRLSGLEDHMHSLSLIEFHSKNIEEIRASRLNLLRQFSEGPPGLTTQIPWLGNREVSVRKAIALYHKRRDELLAQMRDGRLTEVEFHRIYEEPRNAFFSKVMTAIREHRIKLIAELEKLNARNKIDLQVHLRKRYVLRFLMQRDKIPAHIPDAVRVDFERSVQQNFTPLMEGLNRAATKIQTAFREYNQRVKPQIMPMVQKIQGIRNLFHSYQIRIAELKVLEKQVERFIEENQIDGKCNQYMARHEMAMGLPETRAIEQLMVLDHESSLLFSLIQKLDQFERGIEEKRKTLVEGFKDIQKARADLNYFEAAYPQNGRVLHQLRQAKIAARSLPQFPHPHQQLIEQLDSLRSRFEKLIYALLDEDLYKEANPHLTAFRKQFDQIDKEYQIMKKRIFDLGIDYDLKPHEFYRNDVLRFMKGTL